MKRKKLLSVTLTLVAWLGFNNQTHAQFTSGNIAAFVATSNTASNTTGSIVEFSTAGANVVSHPIPDGGSASNGLRFSGSATSTGYLTNSNDGSLLSFTGVNTSNTSSNVNGLNPRGAGIFNAAGTYSLAVSYTGTLTGSPQTRSATTLNNTAWFIADQNGLYTNNATTPTNATNLRGIKPFGGTVYAMTSNVSNPVGTFSSPTATAFTALPGSITVATAPLDFYLVSSGSNGSAFDVLYMNYGTGIYKYSLVSGSWISNGTYTSQGGFGLAAKKNGSGADLFLSTGTGATSANSVVRLTDAAGFNSAINITSSTTIYTAASGNTIKGVAFAPITSCTPPAITSITSNTDICAGTSLNFSLTATGSAALTYAWTGPNSFTSALQNPSIASATTAATGTYFVTVTNSCGNSSSSTAATVNALPVAVITPGGATTFCAGGSLTLTSSAGVSYLWSDNETTQSINVTSGGNYSVTVTNSTNCSAMSSATGVTVNQNVTPAISIGASPGNTICSGTNVLFTAAPVNGGAAPSYQWKLNGNNVGGDSATYANNALADGDIITCVLTSNAVCAAPSTATSNSVTITVTTSVIPSVTISSGSGASICSGTAVTFTASPTNGGSTPSYQWRLNGNNAGGDSATYANSTLADQDVVSCVMTSSNSCASPASATSNGIVMNVTASVTPSVSIAAVPGNMVCAGTNVMFTASPVNGGTPSYQWKKNGVTVGTNSSTYADNSLADHDTVSCIMTSTVSCVTSSTATSQNIIVTVHPLPAPSITGAAAFCTGDSAVLDAGAGYASYLWSNSATTQTITVTSSGSFSVEVSDGTCSGTSATVSVTTLAAPGQPGNFTASSANVHTGESAVVYTIPNVAGVTYSWSYSGTGVTINGSSNSITVNFSLTATSGTLSVTATNSCGTSLSRDLAVTVTALPNMRITEFMYNGSGAGGAGEFVEFTNVGSTAIDMTGWSFDDNSRLPGSQSLTAFGTVQPGESVILTELNAGVFRTNWNLCAGIKVIGNNANNLGREDEINLYDSNGVLVDRITYGDQTFSPGSIRTNTKSGWVSAAGLGANAILQWTLSLSGDAEGSLLSTLGEIGSPGKSTRATVAFDPCIVVNGAPTIAIDVTATSNLLDGGVSTSPQSPYGLSGVMNDATDPGSMFGIDFTIGDDVTPVNSLTVSIASSNTTVVPLANAVLSGSGASRNLKITPAAIGYSNITVTVNDGTNGTSYIINYASSDGAPAIDPVNTFWHTGMSDGSDGIALDNDFYISGDDELDVLNVYSRSASGLPLTSYNYASDLALPQPSNPEVDVEAATRSNSFSNKIYWTGSMSNGKLPYDNKPNRDRLFATTVTGTGAATSFAFSGYVNIRAALLAWGDANGYDFTASAAPGVNSKALAGFSLEGLVFGPDGTTLYLGLRAPLVPTTLRHKAVIAPILNFEAWFNNGAPAGAPAFGAPIELDLDNRGIRDITRLSNGTYIIIAGSPIDDGGINNIYKWSGYATDAPLNIQSSAGYLLNMEGVMQVNDSAGLSLSKLQIITDGGAVNLYGDNNEAKDFADLNLRKFRSDVITGLDLDICSGFTASIAPGGNTAICLGSSVSLAATTGVNNSYLWSTGATTATINASSFGNYSVTVTSTTTGCAAVSPPVSVTNALPSDFNGDHITDNIDFLSLLGLYNQSCAGCAADLNHDGIVNNVDFLILLGQFNHTCP
jgi:hypothetical protein